MKHISILVPQGAILGSLEGTRQLFTQVNNFMEMQGAPPLFKVQLVGLSKETGLSNGLYTINADQVLSEVKKTDLIIIPAVDGELTQAIEANKAFLPWITKQHSNGAEVASLCLGAFILASTGLLNGKRCATHWLAANQFRQLFPEVELVTEKIITDEQGIYSSGGAFSYLNLILYLIEKYAGKDMAILCAKIFAIEIERYSQSSFMIFNGQKDHTDAQIKQVQEYIEQHYTDKITVEQLADMLSINRRSLERRFKKATANSINEYLQRVRVEAAKNFLETTHDNVSEAMYKAGYTDNKAFRVTFKRITGLSPVQYRNKYNRTRQEAA